MQLIVVLPTEWRTLNFYSQIVADLRSFQDTRRQLLDKMAGPLQAEKIVIVQWEDRLPEKLPASGPYVLVVTDAPKLGGVRTATQAIAGAGMDPSSFEKLLPALIDWLPAFIKQRAVYQMIGGSMLSIKN
jgi:hypothetical protein